MTPDPKRIGARIRSARERLGRNKNQMAREIGTSWQHIDRWEKGATIPQPDSLKKLAVYLGVSVDHLLGAAQLVSSDEPPALTEFLESYAPRDLSGVELDWLRRAPLGEDATPGRYVDLLRALRAGGAPIVRVGDAPTVAVAAKNAPKPRSGTHAKVGRDEALAPLTKKQH